MKLSKNERGKFSLLDENNEIVEFDYAVDANEALALKKEDGNLRYSMLIDKRTIVSKKLEKEAKVAPKTALPEGEVVEIPEVRARKAEKS